MDCYNQIIVRRIRELCRKRKISINRLADMSGVRQSTLANIMHGESRNPRIGTLHKIALALGMTVAELLDFPELNEYSFEDEEDGMEDEND